MSLVWWLWIDPASAGVVLNEIMADPGGVDANCDGVIDTTDDEFVEIVNIGPGPVDLTDAVLSDLQSDRFTFPGGTLQEGEAVVLFSGGTPALDGSATAVAPWCVDVGPDVTVLVAGGTLSLNNSGDDLQLRGTNGAVLASASYGSAAGDDQSIVLDPELYGLGYVKHSTVGVGELASPGRMTDLGPFVLGGTPVTCDVAADATGLVINELMPNPSGADADFEWVELYNGSGVELQLSAWAIEAGTQSFSVGEAFPAGTTLPADGYLVVGQTALPEVDVVAGGFSMGNATNNSDGVRVVDCNGDPVDTVIYGPPDDYGDPNPDGWIDDSGAPATSIAPQPDEGRSLGREPDGADTDRSGDDIVSLPFPTPGTPNDGPPQTCGGAESGLVVNELMPNPDGADEGLEWVELFHGGTEPIDLTDWSLEVATSSYSSKLTWTGGTIAPGEFLLLGGADVLDTDEVVELGMGNASSNSDAVRILDCLGFPADTVIYGSPNDDAYVDDTFVVATSLAPAPGEGAALARVSDGFDTDASGTDFVVTLDPSPGLSNPEVEPVVCTPSEGNVVLNELLPDPDGADDDLEWVELYNRGSAPVSVSGWSLSAGTSDFDTLDVTLPGGVEIPAGGWLVIGGEQVAEADVVLPFSLGNGTGTDGVQLVDCEGTAVDTVLYGETPNEDQMRDDTGEVVPPYGDPGANEVIARVEDGVDTDSADDWIVKGAPTPGASNVREVGEVDDPLSSGCGCGQRDPGDATGPEARDPNGGGCTTAPLPLGGLELLVVLGVVARRRDR